jgi:glycosyltransferase involved in cell wall biosynthesis
MRVLHVIPSVSPLHGGPSFAVRGVGEALAALGIDVDVATTTANGRGELSVPFDGPVFEQGVRYFYFRRQHPKFWTFSWPLTRWLTQHAGAYDILHVHALFSYPTLPACWAARRHRVPYVLRPLGTLDPWSLRSHRWKKAPYFHLFERRNLLGAAAIHAVSQREQRAIEALGLTSPVVTIPLGVDPMASEDSTAARRQGGGTGDIVNLLFLSRLHPKKGIELLLDAVGFLTADARIRLFVAGDGDAAYVARLKDRAKANGLSDRMVFTGFVTGAERRRLLNEADLFVLPSYDENFGMAVAEALSAGLPVVVSEHVALADRVREAGAGLVVPCDAQELARAIATLVDDPNLRHCMGQAGRRLAQAEFSWPEVARRLTALYEDLIAKRGARSDVRTERDAVSRRVER